MNYHKIVQKNKLCHPKLINDIGIFYENWRFSTSSCKGLLYLNLHPNEDTQGFGYYPFAVNLDRCVRSCNTHNDLNTLIKYKLLKGYMTSCLRQAYDSIWNYLKCVFKASGRLIFSLFIINQMPNIPLQKICVQGK